MKTVKGFASAVMAFALAMPSVALAGDSVFYDVDTTRVTFSVDTTLHTVTALTTEEADANNIIYAEQLYGNGGIVADTFRMTDSAPSGGYVVSVVPEGGTEVNLRFRHINPSQAASAVGAIASASSASAVESLITNNIADLGIEPTYYLANSASLAEIVYNFKTVTMTPQQFWKNYLYASILNETQGQTEAVITPIIIANADILKIDKEELQSYSQSVKDEIASRFSVYDANNGTDFGAEVQEWIALARLNNAENVEDYKDILFTTYASMFPVNMTAYNASSYQEAIISDMMDSKYTTKEAVVAAFATQSAKERGNAGGGGSSSGGGGGGSSSGGTTSTVVIPANPSVIETNTLKDIGGHWAEVIIKDLFDKGVVKGTENKFYPNKNITRAEFCTLIAQAFYGGKNGSTDAFADVNPDNWYYTYVGLLSSKGIVSGMGDGTFGANRNITRQDMAAIIARVMKDLKKNAEVEREMADFTDAAEIASYSAEAVEMLYTAGIISGYEDGSFMPRANLTKAEAATVIYKLLNK